MDKLLTIAIAAYNKEKELPKCLDSIIVPPELQKKVQVIVVNDGSKDRTLEVAEKYEAKYPGYISVINQANGNYGKVMNTALSLAEGKYFRTLDADDWYDTEAYVSFLMELRESDADMILSERKDYLQKTNSNEQVIPRFDKSICCGKDIEIEDVNWNSALLRQNANIQHITYKTEIVKQSRLKWIEGISYTDTMFDFWPLDLIKTVRFIPQPVYVYFVGSDDQSMSPINVVKNFQHFKKVADAMAKHFVENKNLSSPLFTMKCHYMVQIMSFVYASLMHDDTNLEDICCLHQYLCQIPELEEKLVIGNTYHKIKYVKGLKSGKLPLSFRIIRFLHL